jgi:hypothetical protein
MTGPARVRLDYVVTVTLVTLGGSVCQSSAAGPPSPPAQVIDLPAGLACADFDLRVETWNNPNRVFKEFTDKNGNVVRLPSAGKGNTLACTNLLTNETLTLKANGSVEHTAINPDGSQTVVDTEHNVVILFPTDVPAGPTTMLYVGRVVFTIDTQSVFTLQSVSGNSTDICTALS